MSTKHFVINPSIKSIGNDAVMEIENNKTTSLNNLKVSQEELNKKVLSQQDTLKFIPSRVIIKINPEVKNYHTFDSGLTIRRERIFNNFNRRETQPVNAIVISAENIPTDSEILIGHNALHDSTKIFNYKNESDSGDIRYYSIPESECFAWRNKDGKLQPIKGFAFALRVFEPYTGSLEGVPHEQIKDTLYITSGEYAGNICLTLKAADYCIVYQDTNGKEGKLIRCRHFENEDNEKEELIAVSHELTNRLKKGNLLIGIDEEDCKTLKEYNK